jgi:imidazolonepropionase-like amidohydrolase
MRFVSPTEFYNRVLPSLGPVDTPYFYSLVNTLLKNDTWICTNFAGHMPSKAKFEIGDSSRNEYRLPFQKKQLLAVQEQMKQITAERSKASSPQVYFAIMANKKGVPLLAGTQFEDIGTPGMSLHDELYWFVEGGLSPAEALRTATINPALFLNKEKDLGTVEAGKLADLVLLDANPLEDISNTRKINSVIINGQLLQRKDLNSLLQQARERAKKN